VNFFPQLVASGTIPGWLLISIDHSLPWGLPKITFFINRYVTPPMIIFNAIVLTLVNLNQKFCGFWLQWQAWPTLFAITTVELMVIIRVTAMYGNSKLVFRSLFGLWLCEVGSMLGIAGWLYRGTAQPVPSISFLPGCYSISFAPWLYGYWVAPVVLESIIMIVMVSQVFNLFYRTSGSTTLKILSRDSLVYFSLMFSLLISNLFIFKYAPAFVSSLLIGPSSSLACVAAARMMMNLRGIHRGHIQDSLYSTPRTSNGVELQSFSRGPVFKRGNWSTFEATYVTTGTLVA